MKRSSFSLGDVTVNCFLTDSGEYLYSLTDVSSILNKHRNSALRFVNSEEFKQGQGKGLVVLRHSETIDNGRGILTVTYSLVPSWVVTEYLLHHAMSNGDKLAGQVISLLARESLDKRASLVLDGNTQAVQDKTDTELAKLHQYRTEQLKLKAGTLFTNWMRVQKFNTTLTHDYLTSKLVGRTAKQSRELPLTYPDRTTVGLNHYPSNECEQMELLTLVKLYCASNLGYRKGWTYQDYIDYAIDKLAI
jgi:hypothetical protein